MRVGLFVLHKFHTSCHLYNCIWDSSPQHYLCEVSTAQRERNPRCVLETMQWKRNMSIQKDQNQSSISNVGLCPKRLWDSGSVRSPTSPLDAKVLPNADNPRSSSTKTQKRSWDCSKVGLSIVESLEDRARNCGKFLISSPERKKISLSPQMMVKKICVNPAEEEESKPLLKDSCKVPDSKSEPVIHNKGESNVVFEIGDTAQELGLFVRSRSCPLNSYKTFPGLTTTKTASGIGAFALKDMSSPPHFIGGCSSQNLNTFPPAELKSNNVPICSSNEYLMSLSPSEIQLSEDYTCVITHGPNPKITHIFGDCILETNARVIKNSFKIEGMGKGMTMFGNMMVPPPQAPIQYPSSQYFLSFCHHCNKKLEKGKDIYIYGGDKAFCSSECREIEIKKDEELEKSQTDSENSPKPKIGEKLFEANM